MVASHLEPRIRSWVSTASMRCATTYNIDAVNMSLGGGQYSSHCDTDSRKQIIDLLRGAGIATVISAGNSG